MRKTLTACASAFALSCAFGAQAQEAYIGEIDDVIVVTSQFREQSVLEVPIAVTAVDGEFLNTIGVTEFDELSRFTPGFVVQEQSVNNPGFVLRGITSDDGASNIEPRVSVFQNGVSISRSRGSVVQLFDIERVEVLKGPQGTLFGRSAQIGAVHVITQKPTYEYEGYASVEFGNFDQQQYQGAVNIPLIDDKLAFRAAAFYERRAGFVDNTSGRDLNGTDSLALRGSLRFEPTETVTIDLIGNYGKDTPPGSSFKSGVIPALGGTTDPNEFASLNTFGNFLDGENLSVDRELFDITGIINWELSDAWSVTSTTSYREFDSLEVFDPDGSAFDILIFAEDAEGEQFSSDVRFNYDNGGRLKGFFGGGVFFEEGSQAVPLGADLALVNALNSTFGDVTTPVNGVAFFDSETPELFAPLFPVFLSGDPALLEGALFQAFLNNLSPIPPGVFQQEEFTNFADNSSFDVFGEIAYQLTDRLELTVGGRYTRDNKETLFSSAIVRQDIPGAPGVFVVDSGGQISSDDADIDNTFDGFAWRAVLNYEFSDGKFVYFNYSRGRRPEVIEDQFAVDPDTGEIAGGFTVIPAETVNSYEVGLKGAFLEGLATVELAGYYYGYSNFQTSITEGNPPSIRVVNGGNADSYGAELGLTLNPTDTLDVFLTYAYNRGRFDDVDDNGDPQIFAGNQFRLAPDHSFAVGFNYQHPTSFGTFFLTPTFTWQSEVFFENDNQGAFDVVLAEGSDVLLFSVPSTSEESYGLLNIRGGLDMFDGRLRLEGYVENLLDEEYIVDAGNTGGDFSIPTFIAGPPRFFGGGITVRF